MLRSLKELKGYTVNATDGNIGKVEDFLLDDESWAVRYLVVETGHSFLDERRVLISPISFREVDWPANRFHVALTIDKVKNAPSVDVAKPVSRQHEQEYSSYYGHPYYWGHSGIWGMGAYPGLLAGPRRDDVAKRTEAASGDAHLRSATELRGYHVQGTDEAIGHVEDFVVDDETWAVRYLVVDTRNWWFGKKVLISPHWASSVRWDMSKVYVDMSRQAIKDSPEWNPAEPINRAFEARLHDHYHRAPYWPGVDREDSMQPSRRAG